MLECMINALTKYRWRNNGELPQRVYVFRDGIGGPTMVQKILDGELQEVVSAIHQFGGQQYNPKILYVLVDKRINHRLFENVNANGDGSTYMNPGAGTVLDMGAVEDEGNGNGNGNGGGGSPSEDLGMGGLHLFKAENSFDFFMIPHSATVATALPVHFRVVHNTTGMNKKAVETLIYHQCYAYYGFGGGIKVPAACMYAHKLVNYAHDIEKLGKSNMLQVLN